MISIYLLPDSFFSKSQLEIPSCFFDSACSSFAQEVFFCPTCPSPAGGSLTHSQALALSKRARDVTALRCSEPLRSKVGGASKPSPDFAGWDRLGKTGKGKKSVRICEICGSFLLLFLLFLHYLPLNFLISRIFDVILFFHKKLR